MMPKKMISLAAALTLLLAAAPWLMSEDAPPPADEAKKPGAGVSIMTAEQGEALQAKVDKLLEDQKKLLEKIDQMQKDIEFIKAASRTR